MEMRTSEEIKDLAEALAKAQGQIESAKKDSVNPHFNKKYADLASVWEAIREPLSSNGLSIIQLPGGGVELVTVITRLMHSSGQFIESEFSLKPTANTPQAIGSALTYARRYTLMAMAGVAPEDDDGNAASTTPVSNASPPSGKKKNPSNDVMTELHQTIGKIQKEYSLTKEEMQEATGLETLKGLALEPLQVAVQKLMDYCMDKKINAAVGEPPGYSSEPVADAEVSA